MSTQLVQRWRCLAYADGPLAGRNALHGFWPDDAIPERLTATAGTVYGTVPTPVPGDPARLWHLPTGIVTTPGRPVRYELREGAYRFAGEGAWPEHEPAGQEGEPLDPLDP